MIIQSKLNAPKNLFNKFGGYAYRSCEGILEALKPLLKNTGCTLTISDDIVEIGGRVYVEATATLKNAEGEAAYTTAFAREEETKKGMDAAQITGAASSYARKYALNGLFCIDDTKDPDSTNKHNKESAPKAAPKAAAKKAKEDEPANDWDIILDDIKRAKTVDELNAIYRDWTGYQKDERFLSFLSDRKQQLIEKNSLL